MIIDVTREMDDEEYEKYLDIVRRYDEKHWLMEQEKRNWCDSDDYDDYDNNDRFDQYYISNEVWNMTTFDEDYYLNELSRRVTKCVNYFRKDGWIVIERLVDYHMILWLDRQEVSYFVIHDPMEFDYFWLAIKDEYAYKFFNAKWRHTIDVEYFKGKGWIAFNNPCDGDGDQVAWCKENLGDDFICGMNRFYFTEEAFMMYKLRWL